jgi:glycyl-tRNA synthetase
MDMEKLVSLCKRRGFIFQSSEIYGGINGFWDYGPLGVELKKNIKDAWWQDMVRNPRPGPDGREISMVGVDCAIIMNPKVWVASGHVGGFADPMVDCRACKSRFQADQTWAVLYQREHVSKSVVESTWDELRDINNKMDEVRTGIRHDPETVKALQQRSTDATSRVHPDLIKSALASKEDEAIALTELTKQEKKKLSELEPIKAVQLTGYLPRFFGPAPCPSCGEKQLTEPRSFNLMFKTFVGAVEDASAIAYLRPETAQGIFANFRNVLDSTRLKLPFGIAQIGKAFRNEINPRNYTFRSREFEQMEIEFFCHPAESRKWYEYWREVRKNWYTHLGIRSDKLRPREQGKEELAHYSIGTTDIEYLFPFSEEPQELEGVAHRGAYDLTQHAEHSGKDMTYFDEEAWERDKASRGTNSFREWLKTNPATSEVDKYQFVPHVIEPSAGADRFTLAVLCEAYAEDEVGGEARTVLRFHPRLAPIKAAVLPLVNKERMPEVAQKLYRELKKDYNVFYDDKGAVGRRYRRQDEAGTPFCFTIDGQTLQDQTVTIRFRDSLEQRRIPLGAVADELRKLLQPTL